MPKYKVYVEWVVTSTVEVEANSFDEAIMEVESNDSLIPSDGDYLAGSLEINHEISRYLNKNLEN
jgi:hypothetical protein